MKLPNNETRMKSICFFLDLTNTFNDSSSFKILTNAIAKDSKL